MSTDTQRIIHVGPIEIGGEEVTTVLATDYLGPSKVVDQHENVICAFADFNEAKNAAIYATTPDGGYGSVEIQACSIDEVTHEKWSDWAF